MNIETTRHSGEDAQQGPGQQGPGTWIHAATPSERLVALVSAATTRADQAFVDRQAISMLTSGPEAGASLSPFAASVQRAHFFFSAVEVEMAAAGVGAVGPSGLSSAQKVLLELPSNPLVDAVAQTFIALEEGSRGPISEALGLVSPDRLHGLEERDIRRAAVQCSRAISALQSLVDDQLGRFFDQSAFARETREYRSGRGGFDIIDHILQNSPSGSTLLGCFLDRAFLNAPAAEAHRQRVRDLSLFIDEAFRRSDPAKPFFMTSVGCGPAAELVSWLGGREPSLPPSPVAHDFSQTWSDPRAAGRVNITLVDKSLGALDLAQSRIGHALQARGLGPDDRGGVQAVELDVQTYVRKYLVDGRETLIELGRISDLRECAGLIDYLDKRTTALLMGANYYHLRPGGYMIFTVVAPNDPFDAARYTLLKWPLITRGRNDLIELGKGLRSWSERLRDSGQFMDPLGRQPPRFDANFLSDMRRMPELLQAIREDTFPPGAFCVIDGHTLPGASEGLNQYIVFRRNREPTWPSQS